MDYSGIKNKEMYDTLITKLQEVFTEVFDKATSQLERRMDTLLEKIKELNCKHAYICFKCGLLFHTDNDAYYNIRLCGKCFSNQDNIEITMWGK